MQAKALLTLLGLSLALDGLSTVLLLFAVHSWSADHALSFHRLSDFRGDVVDNLLWYVGRAVVVPFLTWLACWLGKPLKESEVKMQTHSHDVDGGETGITAGSSSHSRKAKAKGKGRKRKLQTTSRGSSERSPLLSDGNINAGSDGEDEEGDENEEGELDNGTSTSTDSPKIDELGLKSKGKVDYAMIAYEVNQRSALKRNVCVGVLFVCNMIAQGYVGIKCVSFDFSHVSSSLCGVLMGMIIVFINLQSAFAKMLVSKVTAPEGHFVPEMHLHPLHFFGLLPGKLHKRRKGHVCDLCQMKMRTGYRCVICDFDCCTTCFSSKDKSGGEGVLRGDKGVREEVEVSNLTFTKRALIMCKPEAAMLSLAFTCLIITSLSNLLLPDYQGRILNQVVDHNNSTFHRDVMFFLILSIITGAFGSIQGLALNIVGRRMSVRVRDQLFQNIVVQDIAFFDGSHTGDLVSRLSNDASAMVAPAQTMLSSLLQNGFALFGGIAMCFVTSWRLSFLAFVVVAPISFVTDLYASWSKTLNYRVYMALGDATAVATEALSNIRTVRSFSTETREVKKYRDFTAESLRYGITDAFGNAVTYALTNYLDLGAGVLILWYGGTLALPEDNPRLSVGALITFQLYFNMINSAYKGLIDQLNQFTRAGGAAQRILSLLDSLPDIDPNAGIRLSPSDVNGELVMQDVHFHYQMRAAAKVIRGVSLTVPAGKVVSLVGKSGGGKSTLVHLFMRFYDPREGRILLDGVDLRDLNLASYHQHVGIVSQDTQLFRCSVEENIAYGTESYTPEQLVHAAKMANAHDFISALPNGYATRIGERGLRLSGGQRQRLAIARVFLHNPKILLLDEATSALDTESEALVQEALDRLISAGGRTVILVAHRLSTVINSDCIFVINEGQVAEQGTHAELLTKNGIYARLVKRQLEKQNNEISEQGLAASGPSDLIDNLM